MYSNLTNFAGWLRRELADRHWTVAKLAKVSSVHPNTIRNYLANRCEPSYYNVRLIVWALGYELGAVPRDNK
jgi:transcriptional regulator with XRE-family HTH domain